MKAFFTLCLALCSFLSFSQTFSLEGRVIDSLNQGVPYASIALTNPEDSTTVQFAITKEEGVFSMSGIDSGSYLVVIASYGYDVAHSELSVYEDVVDQMFRLHSNSISLEEVMFRAPAIPILITGDTVIYNANSFKTQTNATVEDLIKKMPGITINKDGSVSNEGQGITKILINGKEFFGGNVQAATKNIDASLVDKVEVIDRKTDEDEFTGEDDNQREKVINLILKEDQAQGYFGTIRGGGDFDNFYDLKGNMNFFKGSTQLSIIGGNNNIDRRLYGWNEMSTLQSFEVSPFNNWNRGITWWNSGVSTRRGVGANLHYEPSSWMKADVSYVLSEESSIRETQNSSEIYLDSSTLYFQNNSESTGAKNAHELNAKIEMEDSLNRVVIRAKYATDINSGLELSRSFNFLSLPNYLNSGVNRDDQESDNNKSAVKVHWTLKSKRNKKNHLLVSAYWGGSTIGNNFVSFSIPRMAFSCPSPLMKTP